MKIEFRVLWIEDNFENVETSIRRIKNKMKKYGFVFKVDKKTSISDDEIDELGSQLNTYNPYDMIFFDYDLGASLKGHMIAKRLRTNIYTDMIFYSGAAPTILRKELFDAEVEGVYTASRPRLFDDTWEILEDHIKKICDINSMRGVLLDEMSKIDLLMRTLCKSKFDALEEDDKKEQVDKIIQSFEDRIASITKQKNKLDHLKFSDMISKPKKTEFNTIRTRLKSITTNDIFSEDGELKNKQDLRNKFAHNMAIYDDEKGIVKLEGLDEEYDFKKFTQIRLELIALSSEIQKLFN